MYAIRSYYEEAPATAVWLQDKGVAFHSPPYYLAKGPARIQPVGPIGVLFHALWRAAQAAGVEFRYASALRRLLVESGRVVGVFAALIPMSTAIAAKIMLPDEDLTGAKIVSYNFV